MRTIVTIVNTVSTTSMPINEFLIYRESHIEGFKQILIVCDDNKDNKVEIPGSIRTYYVGRKIVRLRCVLKQLSISDNIVYHLHHQNSALLFFIASVGLNIRRKSIFTIHSTFSNRDFFYKVTTLLCVLFAKKVTCVSNFSFTQFPSWVRQFRERDFFPIVNGVDLNRINKIKAGIPEHCKIVNKKRLVCIARIIPIKNQKFLVDVIAELPQDYELVLIGKEDSNYDVRKYAITKGVLDRVIFTGLLYRDEVYCLTNSGGIYVSASMVEGMPVSVLEAMSFGLVPILSNIGPHKEIASKCDNVFIESLEVDRWVTDIYKTSMLSDEEYNSISKGISDCVSNLFSLDDMHNKYSQIYKSLL